MIHDIADDSGRHIFPLVRALDCPESMLSYECAAPSGDFKICEKANVLDTPEKGARIRATCGDDIGPEYIIP